MMKSANQKSVRKDTQDCASISQNMEAVNWDQSVRILMMTITGKRKIG